MFLAVHAAVGAIAGNAVSNPVAAFSLGFISHFFTDMIPHGDENMYEGYKNGQKVTRAVLYVALDSIATIVLIAVFFIRQDFFNPVNVALGIAGGLLPDLLVGAVEILKPKNKRWLSLQMNWFHGFHMKNHHLVIGTFRKMERDIPLKYGLLLQGVVLTLLVRIIL
jgi:xanthine/uracil permease